MMHNWLISEPVPPLISQYEIRRSVQRDMLQPHLVISLTSAQWFVGTLCPGWDMSCLHRRRGYVQGQHGGRKGTGSSANVVGMEMLACCCIGGGALLSSR